MATEPAAVFFFPSGDLNWHGCRKGIFCVQHSRSEGHDLPGTDSCIPPQPWSAGPSLGGSSQADLGLTHPVLTMYAAEESS